MAVREPDVSPRTKRWVHLFLAVFAVAGVAHLELFPFSGFRLFAEVRHDERTSWQLIAVVADGDRIPIVLDDLPLGYRQSWRLIPGMAAMDPSRRDEICDAWVTPLRDDGVAVDRVEVHRTVTSLRRDGPPPREELLFECSEAP